MKTLFFLARHGETQWNKLQKLQGQLDSPLTKTGLIQAKSLAQLLETPVIDRIISSPLPRAELTANIINQTLALPLQQHPALIERHFGDWQGSLITDVNTHSDYNNIFLQVTADAPPNGETGEDCARRFKNALIEIAETYPQQAILIMTHGDILRCFLEQVNQNSANDELPLYANCCVSTTEFDHLEQSFSISDILQA
ncbi:histidine phosphatase family protein [Moritella viscosa]|uniref:Phosphoglycerate mutase family protein n=1 Tax=Moritella viscosa TaxID=80854 RepID=A0A090IJV5_9GAMM|nr:histidine phosphatase family protein [Moritella viscosa]CED61547.1 phosphoglycerate mutase [Moritella viscosa]SGY89517.1 Phosphoglycerate mutase family protein [Moritella viscosa]SGY97586.1 Phosphoglycerate mutase family protein [Moritella viscosa]SGY97706.1 Phosphoglycerate mutase family protein [Moritella viscosa]SHO04835.1 Phosphoglycerate mutase family protein [Moritella viscosa]